MLKLNEDNYAVKYREFRGIIFVFSDNSLNNYIKKLLSSKTSYVLSLAKRLDNYRLYNYRLYNYINRQNYMGT